jgi:MFS transporter, ACDE family, multidrug resistance protein
VPDGTRTHRYPSQMATRYLPLSLRHSPTPQIKDFALLAGLEAAVRGTLISAMPLTVYDTLGSAAATSRVYFIAGIVSLIWGLLVPSLTRIVPRRWTYTLGCTLYLCGMALAITGTPTTIALSLICNAMATVTIFVCFNAYVLDYIDRADLSRGQSTQMVYAATSWSVGPLLGVALHEWWAPAPFILAGFWAMCLLTTFWFLRLGNGKQIARAKTPALNPLAYLMPFFQQRRLIAGWLFAVIRSCGWWVYVVYLPIFCIEAGLGNKVGGIALSTSNALLFVAPVISRAVKRHSVRRMVRMAFGICGALFALATIVSPLPWLTVAAVMCASVFLVTLDVVGGLPFMMAVKPSQRTEMAAVYSTFRDVSGIATPGAAYLVLLVAPLPGIFAACAVAMAAAFLVAGRLHPRLGAVRPARA